MATGGRTAAVIAKQKAGAVTPGAMDFALCHVLCPLSLPEGL
jgi:hypothetical protein